MNKLEPEDENIRSLNREEKWKQLKEQSFIEACRLCRDTRIDPEQLAQEALRKLVQSTKTGNTKLTIDQETNEILLEVTPEDKKNYKTSLESYLHTTLQNLFIDLNRGRNKTDNNLISLDELNSIQDGDKSSSLARFAHQVPYTPAPDDEVINRLEQIRHKELLKKLQAVLATLPPEQQRIFITYRRLAKKRIDAGKNKSGLYKEVGDVVGKTPANVGVVIQTVRRKLKNWLLSEAELNPNLPTAWLDVLKNSGE